MKIEEVYNLIEEMLLKFGFLTGIIVILLLIMIAGIVYWFKSRLSNISKEISSKAVGQFNKQLETIFRDEVIRKELIVDVAKESINKKLKIYQQVYELYFEYQNSWTFDKDTPPDEIKSLSRKILDMREGIFVESIYLGGYLTDKLIKIVVNMRQGLRKKLSTIRNPNTQDDGTDNELRISDLFDEVRKWIQDNIFPDQTIKQFEFTEEQNAFLKEERDKIVEEPLQ